MARTGETSWQKMLFRQQQVLETEFLADLGAAQRRVNATTAYGGKYNIRLRRVLNNSKFPDNVQVIYAYPNPMSYEPRAYGVYREVTHVVVSAFGSYYDAQLLNKGDRVISNDVRISGADPNQSYHSPNRVWSGIRSVLVNSGKKLSGAHFYIDRLGNLIVMGDVDMTMIGSVPCSPTAIFVALEESIAVPTADWYASRPTPRAVLSGDDRNVVSDGFTEAQYMTLGILIKKLELGFPDLVGGGGGGNFTAVENRAVSLGYADRDGLAVKEVAESDTPGYVTDAWPILTTEEEWQELFEFYVDVHEDIEDDDIWKNPQPLSMPWLSDVPLTDVKAFPQNQLARELGGDSLGNASDALRRVSTILSSLDKTQMAEQSARERLAESRYIGNQTAADVSKMDSADVPVSQRIVYDATVEDQESDPTCDGSWED